MELSKKKTTPTAIIIPIKRLEKSKTRLSPFLNYDQRKNLTELLILDTLEKVSTLKNSQTILVCSETLKLPSKFKDLVILNEKDSDMSGGGGVNVAIELANEYIENNQFEESIIVPIDLPLMSITDLKELLEFSKGFNDGICIVPSRRYDGTNVLLRKPNSIINTFYDNNSFYNHIKDAAEKKRSVKVFNFESLMIDLDTIEDIFYILDIYNRIEYYDIVRKNEIKKNSHSLLFLKEMMQNGLIHYKGKTSP
ncbi:MAG: 2-phospho-L-lactate guanylyltransferase [Candidatus Nitrosocosmicus sp.]